MATPLEGRTILVTGSGRGIGSEVAKLAGRLGANVVVADHGVNVDGSGQDEGPAATVAKEITDAGGTAVPNFDTVATEEGGENMIRQAVDTYGRIDGVIHVAGILRDRMVFNMTEQEWDDVIAVHLTGYFNVAKPASVLMRQQRHGRIVGFSSGSGLRGNTGQANYGAAKAGIAGMTRCLARDLGRYGITANSIAPGAATRMTQTVPDAARELRAQQGMEAPRQESGVTSLRDANYVAPMTVYLMTDQAWDVNGKVFHVSGGQVSVAHEIESLRELNKPGRWTIEELRDLVPAQLMGGLRNPAPPPDDLDIPGRPVG
jgi:NAD(P)-dependent dehydrogenase (short-subunit alcohol dehydrogenase family)